jgi:uncharacterized membrane protein
LTNHPPAPNVETPRPIEPYAPDLRISYLFSKAWPLYKENLGLIVGSFAIYAFLTGGLGSFGNEAAQGLGSLVSFVIAGPMAVGLYVLYLRIYRGEEATLSHLFDGFREFGRAFGVYLLSALLTIIGFILLIIPGLVVMASIWPALFLVLEEDGSVTETLQRAWDMTKGYRLQLFLLIFVIGIVALLGLIAFVVGIVFTGAFAIFVLAGAYDELTLAEA